MRMFRNYTLKKPARRYARIGAFYAALLPVVIGLMLLGGLSNSAVNIEKILILPVSMALIFGTPIVAWLSQDAIAKRNNIDYGKLLEIVVLRATILQAVFGSLCIVYIYNYSSNLFEFKSLISTFLSIHTILWGLVTLPLVLVCSIIFKLTALRPIYG